MTDAPDNLADLGVPIREGPIRGKASVEITFFEEGDPRFTRVAPTGKTFVTGVSIETLRERLGGKEGYLALPTGEEYLVRIPPEFKDARGVMVSISVTIVPDEVGPSS